MAKNLGDDIIRVYDNLLSNAPHISSLNIDTESFKKCIKTVEMNKMYKDQELDRAHDAFMGVVLLDTHTRDLTEAKSYIMYPDFFVNTHLKNPEFIHKGQQSLEKSVIIGRKEELNMFLPRKEFRTKLGFKYMVILNIERVMIAPNLTQYKVNIKSIPSIIFYNIYNNVVLIESSKTNLCDDELKICRSRAIHDALKSDKNDKIIDRCVAEFTIINDAEYEKFKEFIENNYGVTYHDTFITSNGLIKSIWTSLGLHKYDNRIKTTINGNKECLPLSLQKTLNKKID